MYYSGFAGSLWSMLAFAGAGSFLFLIGRRLSGPWEGGVIAALAYVSNPSAVYMATTPMAESLIICGICAVVFFLMRVEECPDDIRRLIALSAAVLVLTLLRYEGWFLLGVVALLLPVMYWQHRRRWAEIQARMVTFLALGALGVVFWLIWETVIFHDPLFFSHSKYSAHVIDVVYYGFSQNAGNLAGAISTYWQAMAAIIPLPLLLLAAAGVVLYLWREGRRGRLARVAPLALLGIPAYFVLSMVTGQGAMYVAPAGQLHYNVRYGLIALPLVAVFGTYAVASWLPRRWALLPLVGAAAFTLSMLPVIQAHNSQIFLDRGANGSADRTAVVQWLRQNYDGGRLLVEAFKNNDVTFASHISQRSWVSEDNPAIYNASLTEPQRFVRWLYVGHSKGDAVEAALEGTTRGLGVLDQYYDEVYTNTDADIYRLKPQFNDLQLTDDQLGTAAATVHGLDIWDPAKN